MKTNACHPYRSIKSLLLCLALSSPAIGQEQQDWVNSSGGDFGLPGNWDAAVPTAGDLAWFNLESEGYSVQLDQNRSIGTLQIANDNVVLDLGGFNLDLTDPNQGSWNALDTFDGTSSLMIGRGTDTAGETGSLTIRGGGTFSASGLTLGGTRPPGSTSTGKLLIEGAGTIFNSTGGNINSAILGFRGDADLTVQNGAIANFEYVALGRHSGSNANVTVQGAGTQFNFHFLNIGPRGESHMVVRDGAHLAADTASSLGGRVDIAERHRDASLTIDNATALFGTTRVGLHSLASDGQGVGELNVINGSTVAISDGLNGTLTIGSGASTTVGIVRVDNSELTTSARIRLGGDQTNDNEATGLLLITNGGSVTASANINLWSRSTVHVEGGSHLSVVGFDGAPGGTIEMVLRSGEFDPMITARASSGTAHISGLILNLSTADDFSAAVGDTFLLFDYAGTLNGTFADLSEGDTITLGDYQFQLSYGSGSGDAISLNVTAIPEPSTIATILSISCLAVVIVTGKRKCIASQR